MHGLGGVAFAIAALLAERGLDAGAAGRKATLYWATVHGLVTLTMAGRFSRDEGAALAQEAADDALIAWGVAPSPTPD